MNVVPELAEYISWLLQQLVQALAVPAIPSVAALSHGIVKESAVLAKPPIRCYDDQTFIAYMHRCH